MNQNENINNQTRQKQYYENIALVDIFSYYLFFKKYFAKKYNNRITQITSQKVVFLYPITYPLRISQKPVVDAESKLTKSFAGR